MFFKFVKKVRQKLSRKTSSFQKRSRYRERRCGVELLEDRRLLAILWSNRGTADNDSDGFQFRYAEFAPIARAITNRAIADWEAVIQDFNYDGDNNPATVDAHNNTFNLSVFAGAPGQISGRGQTSSILYSGGRPESANIIMDDNGGGFGWFFDSTPLDDAEFTALANSGSSGTGPSFQASFIDIQGGLSDFYRTIAHEIGHAMGLASSSPVFSVTNPQMTFIGPDPLQAGESLYSFHNPNGPYRVTATITTDGGRHLYEGSHPNDLMNDGRITPVGQPRETLRQFISDFDAQLLADAYGYSVVLPSTINTAHVTLDSQTGTLLVQGGVTSQGASVNETILVDVVGSDIRVRINDSLSVTYATERVPAALVSQIIISGNGGNDGTTFVDPALASMRKDVHWVVSSNQDALDPGTLGNVFVDLDTVVPGRQVSLRAAIQDATAPAGGGGSIYVPRGKYGLTLSGAGGIEQGDLDILKSTAIIGTGAGETIINATGLGDRVFEVKGSGQTLTLDSLTVTGGRAPSNLTSGEMHGGGIFVRNGASLDLRNSAVVDNATTNAAEAIGGGLFFEELGGHFITNSVITNNHSANFTGGVFLGGTTSATFVQVTGSIIAGNTAGTQTQGINDVGAQPNRTFTSGGNNRLGNSAAGFIDGVNGDYIKPSGSADPYVVTGIADTYDRSDDNVVTSVRDAIDKANKTAGAQEIWLSAWKFVLTRQRTNLPSATETDVSQGDLDIGKGLPGDLGGSLTIRGVTGSTSVAWKPGAAADLIFELLGDYNFDRVVDAADYIIWRKNMPGADGDDNGAINGADETLRVANFGHRLTLLGVA